MHREGSRTPPLVPFGRDSRFGEEWLHLFLLIRHVRKIERLASLRQRDPRIAQAFIMFALLGVVFFLRQRCAPGRRFPCGLALGSHVVLFHFLTSTFFPGDRAWCRPDHRALLQGDDRRSDPLQAIKKCWRLCGIDDPTPCLWRGRLDWQNLEVRRCHAPHVSIRSGQTSCSPECRNGRH
jgi:hypothetical protein